MKRYISFIIVLLSIFCILNIPSISNAKESTANPPKIEVEQVQNRWEIIVRLIDESEADKAQLVCNIYIELNNEGKINLMKVDDLVLNRMKKSGHYGQFIGIYSDGKKFPHGTKVIVVYESALSKKKVQASTKMLYH